MNPLSSSRMLQCYYCNEKKAYKDLKSHCKEAHNQPMRQKGQCTLSESFFKPAKRTKIAHTQVSSEPKTETRSTEELEPEKSATIDPSNASQGRGAASLIKQLISRILFGSSARLD